MTFCSECSDCREVHYDDILTFRGCFHPPYHGKWIREIETCPKQDDSKTKEEFIKYLSQQPTMILATAAMYARNLVTSGVSVTEKWETALQQSCALDNAEKTGYMKAMEHTKDRCEHCEYKKTVLRQMEEEQHDKKDSPGGSDPDRGVCEENRESDDHRRGQMPARSAPGSPEDRQGLVRPEGRGVPGLPDQERELHRSQEEKGVTFKLDRASMKPTEETEVTISTIADLMQLAKKYAGPREEYSDLIIYFPNGDNATITIYDDYVE